MMCIDPVSLLIRRRTGLRLEGEDAARFREEVLRRQRSHGLKDITAYFHLLENDQTEFQNLVNSLTVNETYFFREPAQISTVMDHLLPQLFLRKAVGGKIRLLSAGCSTGEEVYTLVMALKEKYGAGVEHIFSVIGVDLDTEALACAAEGRYRRLSFRAMPENLMQRYFIADGPNAWRVREDMKDPVILCPVNLLDDEFPPVMQGLDIIFYRNVSIYFDTEVQLNIFLRLAGLLNMGGYLVVSSTETLSHDLNILSLVEINGQFFYRKDEKLPPVSGNSAVDTGKFFRPETRRRAVISPPPDTAGKGNAAGSGEKMAGRDSAVAAPVLSPEFSESGGYADAETALHAARELIRDRRYSDADLLLDRIIRHPEYRVTALGFKAHILINRRLLEDARACCLDMIEEDSLFIAAYLLLGLIEKVDGRADEAISWFEKALYIDANNWLAHFYLAEIYADRHETRLCLRQYKVVVRLLEQRRFHQHGMLLFPFSFSEQQILHLCRHRSRQMAGDLK